MRPERLSQPNVGLRPHKPLRRGIPRRSATPHPAGVFFPPAAFPAANDVSFEVSPPRVDDRRTPVGPGAVPFVMGASALLVAGGLLLLVPGSQSPGVTSSPPAAENRPSETREAPEAHMNRAVPERVGDDIESVVLMNDRLVRENRQLAVQVDELERETTDLHVELLELELQLFAIDRPAASHADIVIAGDARDDGSALDDAYEHNPHLPSATVPTSTARTNPAADAVSPDRAPDGAERGDVLPRPVIAGYAMTETEQTLPIEKLVIADVSPGSAASRAGLAVGDQLLSIDGLPIRRSADVLAFDSTMDGYRHQLEVQRGGDWLVIELDASPVDLTLRSESIARVPLDAGRALDRPGQ